MLPQLIVIASSGFVAGSVHVVSGPDHLAAVAPLAADSRRSLWRAGLLWAVGHTSGVLVVGLLAAVFQGLLPLHALSANSERLVGVALIVVGLWGFRRGVRSRLHVHQHEHDGSRHTHVHLHHAHDGHDPRDRQRAHDHVHASFSFGVLHGLAGSSHLFGVLPALLLPTREAAVTYLGGYALGTILAMTTFSALMGVVATRARSQGTAWYRGVLYVCSGTAVAVGVTWLLV